MTQGVSVFCFLASYSLAFALEWLRMLRTARWARLVTFAAGCAGLTAHTWYLWKRSAHSDLPPLLSSSHDWFLVLAWMAVLFYLVLTVVDDELPIGMFLLPLVLILIGSAYFVSMQSNLVLAEDLDARRSWAMLHATLLVFGIAGVMIGFVLSMMYLVQHRRLKHKQAGQSGMILPSLERLSRLNWWAVVLSIPLLTLGMLTGLILGMKAKSVESVMSFKDPVIIANTCVWVVMVTFFVWRLRIHNAAGTKVAWRTLWAFGFLLVTLIGLQMLTGSSAMSLKTWHT